MPHAAKRRFCFCSTAAAFRRFEFRNAATSKDGKAGSLGQAESIDDVRFCQD